MCKLLIFGGTTEGRQLAQFCADHRISAWVSVASQYGCDLLPSSEYLRIRVNRMDWQEMAEFMRDKQVRLVVDATHPYAKEVTGNIKRACMEEQIPLLRCLRDAEAESAEEKGVFYVPTAEAAVQMLGRTEGNVFVTTGSKELRAFTALADYENRIYARVLPSPEAAEQCRGLGITGRHLICMQGPFSEELNAAMMGQIDARWMVTKETGKNGGYDEKIRAARRNGASVIVIRREKENGFSVKEVEEKLLAFPHRQEADFSEKQENPVLDSPVLGTPKQEEPEQGNPAQLNTKGSSNQVSNTDSSSTEGSNPIQSSPQPPTEAKRTGRDWMRERESYRELILENIEYDHLYRDDRLDRDMLNELMELMVDTVCSRRETIRIAGDDYPAEVVKSRFLKLNSSHIEYVLDRMRENTTYVRNIKKYLLAALYNAPSTISSYYTSLVNHDLYGGGERR